MRNANCSLVFYLQLICILFAPILVEAARPLSSSAQISILTCDPGNELYSTFGHTGIRVMDPQLGLDSVFNYGIFDFKTEGFYIKFLRGKLDYILGKQSYSRFLREYNYYKRSVYEQVLDLDSIDRQKVYDFLTHNALKENRAYKYDFFFDNCSTRPKDVLEKSVGIPFNTEPSNKSFRNLLDEFLPGLPWSDFGIDLVIGSIADRKATQFESTFLPAYFMKALDTRKNGSTDLVKGKSTILDFSKEMQTRFKRPWFTPMLVFGILLCIEVLIFLFVKKKSRLVIAYDRLWYIIMGLASVLLLIMWFLTDHLATKANWNILWVHPFFLILGFRKSYINNRILLLVSASLLILTLIGWSLIPQQFHYAFIPIICILLLKLFRWFSYGVKGA